MPTQLIPDFRRGRLVEADKPAQNSGGSDQQEKRLLPRGHQTRPPKAGKLKRSLPAIISDQPPPPRSAPLPWSIEVSGTFANNGIAHIYLVDADGRKIAAIWGRAEDKILTAELIIEAVSRSGQIPQL